MSLTKIVSSLEAPIHVVVIDNHEDSSRQEAQAIQTELLLLCNRSVFLEVRDLK